MKMAAYENESRENGGLGFWKLEEVQSVRSEPSGCLHVVRVYLLCLLVYSKCSSYFVWRRSGAEFGPPSKSWDCWEFREGSWILSLHSGHL